MLPELINLSSCGLTSCLRGCKSWREITSFHSSSSPSCVCVCVFVIFFNCFSQESEKPIAQRNLLIVHLERIKFFAQEDTSIWPEVFSFCSEKVRVRAQCEFLVQ